MIINVFFCELDSCVYRKTQKHQFKSLNTTRTVYFHDLTAWEDCLNCCVYISHTSRVVWSCAKVPSVTNTQTRMSLLNPHKSTVQRGDPNYQAGGGIAAQYINKFILTGVLGQRNEILYVDCEGGRGGKRLPSRYTSKPITAEHHLLFPHPKSPPPLFIRQC